MIDDNLKWMKGGNIGCTFATLFSRNPDSIGWVRVFNPESFEIPTGAFILSFIFPYRDINYVRKWAKDSGFYEEQTGDSAFGLRYKVGDKVSWVQYFGPDSVVKTRQAPHPELCMCVKLPKKYYWKVGFKGILHLAHANIKSLTELQTDRLWESSHKNTKRILGHRPTLKEAAKTTFNGKF